MTAANLATARAKLGESARETVEGRPTSEAAAASSALRSLMGHVENLTPVPTNMPDTSCWQASCCKADCFAAIET